MAGAAALAFPVLAAEPDNAVLKAQVEALTRQLKALSEQSQRQIDALSRQVQELSQKLEKQPAAGTGAPAPENRNVVVTQQPGNLPGRSVVPPYTAAGPGAPGGVAPVAAAPVSSGGDKVKLSISGQVDRAVIYGNDGKSSNIRNVDNNNSSTRLRIVGEGRPAPDTVFGVNFETEIRPNSSATTTLNQDLPQPASAVTFTARQVEAYAANPKYGGVRLGFGSTASYLTSEVDLSNTAVASYVNISDMNGGFAFRQKSTALVPGGAGGAFVTSPAGAYGPAVGSVFYYFDGLTRDDRVRYDSPVWNGLQLSTSVVDGGAYDVALRYARKFPGFQFAGAVAFADASSRSHAQPGSYGYAGVPAGAGGISLAGTNSAPSSPTVADVSANGSRQFDGSFSILHDDTGLSFTMAGGVRDTNYDDPNGRPLSPNLIYTKLGWQHKFFEIGISAFSVDFAQNEELIFNGDTARAYSLAAVQNIDDAGTELFFTVRRETLDRAFASYYPIWAGWVGARVRF